MITAQGEQIAAQHEQIADLRAKMARLERIVSRTRGNSSMPPSTDNLPGRKPLSRRQRRAAGPAARQRDKQAPRADRPAG